MSEIPTLERDEIKKVTEDNPSQSFAKIKDRVKMWKLMKLGADIWKEAAKSKVPIKYMMRKMSHSIKIK